MEYQVGPPQWVEVLARRIQALGFPEIVRLGIDLVRPVGFLGVQVVLLLQPVMGSFVGPETVERTLALLESSQLQECLIAALDGEKS